MRMDRLPLADELPYEFHEPKISPFWHWVGQRYASRMRRGPEHRVMSVEVTGIERLQSLLGRGDGILLTPNHSDSADASVMLELARQVKHQFTYMAAYQIFRGYAGIAKFMLARVGAFPVDREGTDLKAFKTGVEILGKGQNPLVIFPEGEIYHTCDRLTPIREGAAAVATTAAKRAAERGKTVWMLPVALKYRFMDGHDPLPSILSTMDRLEQRFTWWPRENQPLIPRIYSFAEGLLSLKEMEYLGAAQTGPLKNRLVSLRESILDHLEDRHFGKRRADIVPVRVKELRRACLEKLTSEQTTLAEAASLRRDLNDVFVALQLFSYPGDYLHEGPTVERIAETLKKFQQDILGIEPKSHAPRRVSLHIGEPIDIRARMAEHAKPRLAAGAITTELEGAIQSLLDSIGPGRPYQETDGGSREPIGPRIRPLV
jgi:hypothetical protein